MPRTSGVMLMKRNRQGPGPGLLLHLQEGQGPGAVQVFHPGQVHRESGRRHFSQESLDFLSQVFQVLQGQAAREENGRLAFLSPNLNAVIAPWSRSFCHVNQDILGAKASPPPFPGLRYPACFLEKSPRASG